MNKYILYFVCILIFIIVDAPYLMLNEQLYKNITFDISGKPYTKRYYSAFIVYFALALGIIGLVLPQIRSSNVSLQTRIKDSLYYGGIFGLASYATFDFTMHFMFDKWNLSVSIMDSIWGSLLCSIVTFICSYL